MKRRSFLLQTSAAITAGAVLPRAYAATEPALRFGTCRLTLPQAREAGLEGVQLPVLAAADRLKIADPAVRAQYHGEMRETGLPLCSLMMGLFNEYPLASEPRAPAWLDQCIDATRDLGAGVILIAFFGKGDLLDEAGNARNDAIDEAVRRLKRAAPRASEAGVVLAIENYLNGEQNARILDRIGHESVQVYYDVFNTGTTKGHDVPADLKLLQGRIAQIHFKNGPKYLDEEPAKFEPIAAAIKDTGYRGWIVLETSAPSGDAVADGRRNGAFLRRLFA